MKIWFDLSNSPHINMFAAMIRELETEACVPFQFAAFTPFR